MPDDRQPVDERAVADDFHVFAGADCAGEPLYAALSRAIADDNATIALLMRAPYPQRRPVLLFAAVHDLLLEQVAPSHPHPHALLLAHPLARFYRSVVDERDWRADVEHAMPLFVDFCRTHRDAVVARLEQRAAQTNEVGRCAGLRLALSTLPIEPLTLVDVGCSAGLNLLVDRSGDDHLRVDGSRDVTGGDGGVTVASTIAHGALPLLRDRPPPSIAPRSTCTTHAGCTRACGRATSHATSGSLPRSGWRGGRR